MKTFVRAVTLVLILSIFAAFFQVPVNAGAEGINIEGFEKVSETDRLILHANMSNGEFAVQNKSNGYIWWSNPVDREKDKIANKANLNFMSSQIYISYTVETDKATQIRNNINSYMFSFKKKGLKVEKINGGIKTTYNFPDDGIKLAVRYVIKDGYLSAELDTAAIEEKEKVKLLSVSLLPFFGAGSIKDSGYMMIPDGSGALINFNNRKSQFEEYKQPVYGYDPSIEKFEIKSINETIRMPVFGIKNGDNAFIGIIEKGEANSILNAAVSGKKNSYNNVYSEFNYRVKGMTVIASRDFSSKTIEMVKSKPVSLDKFAVRYCFINGSAANYTGMAGVYRDYLLKEQKISREQSFGKVPFYLELYGSIKKKNTFLGIPYMGTVALTRYNDVPKIVNDLQKKGIKDIVLKYSGWMKSGLDNEKVPTRVDIEGKLGSKGDFTGMEKYLQDNKVDFYPDAELILFQKSGNGIIKTMHSTKTVAKLPAQVFSYFQSVLWANIFTKPIRFMVAPRKLEEVAGSFYKSYEGYNSSRLSVGSMGSMIYSDFGSNGDDRSESVDIWRNILSGFKKKNLSLMTEKANSYALPYVGHVLSAPSYSSEFDIMDETIPFYQIVLSGIKPYSTEPMNLSSQPDVLFLKAVETGSYMMFSGTMTESSKLKDTRFDNLYSTCYKDWLGEAADRYKAVYGLFSKIGGKTIIEHEKCRYKVYRTKFENGIEVITNYNDEAVNVNGHEIKAKNYLVLGGDVQ